MYRYKDKQYYYTLCDYRKGNKTAIIQKLSWLSNRNIPSFNEDVNNFLIEAKNIAKKNNQKDVLSYIKELTSKMKLNGYDSPTVSINSYSLESEKECEESLKNNLANNSYKTAIASIVVYIRQKNNFRVAYSTLKQIDEWQGKSTLFTKEEVACEFIELMFEVIGKFIRPEKEKGILFSKYVSKNWPLFDSETFVKYLKLCKKYTKNWGIKDLESYMNSDKSKLKPLPYAEQIMQLNQKRNPLNSSTKSSGKKNSKIINFKPIFNKNNPYIYDDTFEITFEKLTKCGDIGELCGTIDIKESFEEEFNKSLHIELIIKHKTFKITQRKKSLAKFTIQFPWALNNEFELTCIYSWHGFLKHSEKDEFSLDIMVDPLRGFTVNGY